MTVAFDGGEEAPDGGPRPAEGMISFDDGTRRLTVRLIGGEFIRYQSRFPAEFGCRAEVPAAAFTEAVRRVSLVAERTSPVRLTFGGGAVMIEAQTEGRARAVERVRADFDGSEPAIAFNPHYLLDGLTAAAGPVLHARAGQPAEGEEPAAAAGGRVRIEFTSPAKPALITGPAPCWPVPRRATARPRRRRPRARRRRRRRRRAGARRSRVRRCQPRGCQPREGQPQSLPGSARTPAAAAGPPGSFRYLVVPLRAPARA